VAQPLRFFEMRRAGEVLSRVSDAMIIRDAVSGTTLTIVVDATLVVVTVVAMFLFDAVLAVVACLVLPVFMLAVWAHQPFMKRASRRSMESFAALQAHITEDIQSVETIKACNAEERRGAESDRRLVRMVQTAFSMAMIGLSMGTMSMLLTSGAGIVLLWIGAERAMDGAISVGGLMFFYSLLLNMLGPLERLAAVNVEVQEALVAVDRVGEILDLEVEKLAGPSQERFTSLETGIRLEDVRFRYGARDDVLQGVDMEIPAGSTVAIVGESGSGKTTLLKLLQGFYTPTGGRMLLDGLDMRDYSIASIRERTGVVSQEPWIFNGTIRDNILFGRPDATSGEIAEAVRAAGLNEFVDGLPERYETRLGERGANLSGGQRQRLAIARALVRNPEILIFDEATSHLDTRTESAVRDNLHGALVGKTVVVVAHRLSTIRHADRIFLLEGGRIAESGRHDDLIALGGRYSELYSMQSSDDKREPIPLVEGVERWASV
jgi:ATP-binding cassette subfamily B protein